MQEAPLLTDRILPLENLWGSRVRTFAAQLAEAGPNAAVEIFSKMLTPRFSPLLALQRMLSLSVPLRRVAEDAGMSERSFRRACGEHTGVSPAYLRRILRFRRAAERIGMLSSATDTPCNWPELAVICGYYDQPHLIRDFREFAGCTPGRFVQYSGAPFARNLRAGANR